MLNSSNSSVPQAQVYTDLNGLAKLSSAAQKNDPKAVAEVAHQFESLFMNLMLKSMREANSVFAEGNMLNSENVNTYQQMLDQQLSVSLSGHGGMGLAKILMKQLSPTGQMKATQDTQDQAHDKTLDKGLAAMLHNPLAKDQSGLLKTLGQQVAMLPATQPDVMLTDNESVQNPAESNSTNLKNAPDCPMQPELGNTATALLSQNFTLNATENSTSTLPEKSPFEKAPVFNADVAPVSEHQQNFVHALLPKAQAVADRSGIDAKILIAQAALETGWGKHVIKHPNGSSSYNLFNIKADENWAGKTVTKDVTEYRDGVPMKQRARFRAYDSFTESFQDYLHLVQSNDRYAKAMDHRSAPQDYIRQLHRAGYATDPLYSAKVNQVYQQVIATEGT